MNNLQPSQDLVLTLFNKSTKQRRLIVETYRESKPNTLNFVCSFIKNMDINYDISIDLINSLMEELSESNVVSWNRKFSQDKVEEIYKDAEVIYEINSTLFSTHIRNAILRDQIISTINNSLNNSQGSKDSGLVCRDVVTPLKKIIDPQTYDNCGDTKMEDFIDLFIKSVKDSDYSFKEYHDVLNKVIQKIPQKQIFFEASLINSLDGMMFKEYQIVIPKSNYDLIDVGLSLNICVGNTSYESIILAKRGYVAFLSKDDKITNCIEIGLYGDIRQFVEKNNTPVRGDLIEEFKNFINNEVKFEVQPVVVNTFVKPRSLWDKIIRFF